TPTPPVSRSCTWSAAGSVRTASNIPAARVLPTSPSRSARPGRPRRRRMTTFGGPCVPTLAAQVIASHPPPRARELQADDGDEQHADERVHRQERREPEQRRTIEREHHQKQRRDDRGQLLVGSAS